MSEAAGRIAIDLSCVSAQLRSELIFLPEDGHITRIDGGFRLLTPSNPGYWWGNSLRMDHAPRDGDFASTSPAAIVFIPGIAGWSEEVSVRSSVFGRAAMTALRRRNQHQGAAILSACENVGLARPNVGLARPNVGLARPNVGLARPGITRIRLP